MRTTVTTPKICTEQSCSQPVKPTHYLCSTHWGEKVKGAINECPECGVYKDATYPLCLKCHKKSRRHDTYSKRTNLLEDDPKARDKRQLFDSEQGKCAYCGNGYPYNELQIEHMIPKVKGGPDNIRNCQLACKICNKAKGPMTDREFRRKYANYLPQTERTPADPPINPNLLRGAAVASATSSMSGTFYGVLGVMPSASAEEIRQARAQLLLKFHPDTSPDEEANEKTRRINAAYAILSDPNQRAEYDRGLQAVQEVASSSERAAPPQQRYPGGSPPSRTVPPRPLGVGLALIWLGAALLIGGVGGFFAGWDASQLICEDPVSVIGGLVIGLAGWIVVIAAVVLLGRGLYQWIRSPQPRRRLWNKGVLIWSSVVLAASGIIGYVTGLRNAQAFCDTLADLGTVVLWAVGIAVAGAFALLVISQSSKPTRRSPSRTRRRRRR